LKGDKLSGDLAPGDPMLIRLALLLIVIALSAPFLIPGPDGSPILDARDFFSPPEISLPVAPNPAQAPLLYRYRGESGSWVYQDSPPHNQDYEVVSLADPALVLESRRLPTSLGSSDGTAAAPSTLPLSVERAAQLMEDARAVQQVQEARADEIEAAINAQR
jgi:hypothetical protein